MVNNTFYNSFNNLKESQALYGDGYRLFLVTNENKHSDCLTKLQKEPVRNRAVVATSTFCGLNLTAARGESTKSVESIDYLVFLDVSEKVQAFWSHMQSILSVAKDREDALSRIKQMVIGKAEYFYSVTDDPAQHAKHWVNKLNKEISKGESWLSTDQRFKKIQDIFNKKHFVFRRVNICDAEIMAKIAGILQSQKIKIDTLYLSNIHEYVENATPELYLLSSYQNAVAKLKPAMSSSTILVDTVPREGGIQHKSLLVQRVIKNFGGKDVAKVITGSPIPKPVFNGMDFLSILSTLLEKDSNEKKS